MTKSGATRVRDPERRERIIDAAAVLISQRGYLGVSLSDIGSAAGIVGSGIYRHFDNKGAILVEMFDRVVDHLVDSAEQSFTVSPDSQTTLGILVNDQVELVLRDRALCQVYVREARNLPEQGRLKLRWKQRHYVALWEDALRVLRPETDSETARLVVRAAISSIHSVLNINSELPTARAAVSLRDAACRVLQIEPQPFATARGAELMSTSGTGSTQTIG
ncbi:TetR/AcrR family transcriptional regulator [Rhodococcus oxybenzonivorans]|uniref:TetR/AcrR family transcriptional regulator n=1 Tax=Rhodococcus oxybenzonivorans TaxID=1990687 RepID=UPI0029544E93|nr:TetR/AcrR family transcriptional regulator [Rhodococcus oxybenzonivorans]MDV7353662.1 TetR/AcrR family transcriptional regulator [Rhodococcus oxybenzonivorans]